MSETKMDETGLKPFHPYNIILATQYGKRWEGTFQLVKIMI